jgi:hypothetical protein
MPDHAAGIWPDSPLAVGSWKSKRFHWSFLLCQQQQQQQQHHLSRGVQKISQPRLEAGCDKKTQAC